MVVKKGEQEPPIGIRRSIELQQNATPPPPPFPNPPHIAVVGCQTRLVHASDLLLAAEENKQDVTLAVLLRRRRGELRVLISFTAPSTSQRRVSHLGQIDYASKFLCW